MCVVDVRVRLRSSVGILEEALDLTVDLCTALFLHFSVFCLFCSGCGCVFCLLGFFCFWFWFLFCLVYCWDSSLDCVQVHSLALLAARGLLAPNTWKCKRAQVSLKATIDVPMLGTIIEQNGNGPSFGSVFPADLTSFSFRGCLFHLTLIRLLPLGLLGMSSVWVLYMGSCTQPRGAVVSRPMPWTRLCCSELHRCTPVFLPVGQPGAPASSTRLPAWFVNWSKDVVILQPVYSVGEWHYGRSLATIFVCAYCNALQVFQGR